MKREFKTTMAEMPRAVGAAVPDPIPPAEDLPMGWVDAGPWELKGSVIHPQTAIVAWFWERKQAK